MHTRELHWLGVGLMVVALLVYLDALYSAGCALHFPRHQVRFLTGVGLAGILGAGGYLFPEHRLLFAYALVILGLVSLAIAVHDALQVIPNLDCRWGARGN